MSPIGTTTPRLPLDGPGWTLTYDPHPPTPAATLAQARSLGYRTIPAQVPGTVEQALVAGGVLPDPFVGAGVEATWEIERGDWWFSRQFTLPDGWPPRGTSLVLHGVDTIADVLLNDVPVGSTASMFVPHELAVAAALHPGTNRLDIHVRSAVTEAEQFEYPAGYLQVEGATEALWIRKPGHMYGWDIAPRIVSAGVHRSIELVRRPGVRLNEAWLRTVRLADGTADVRFHYRLSEAPHGRDVVLTMLATADDGHRFSLVHRPTFLMGAADVTVDDPRIWHPRGYGDPALYRVRVEVSVGGEICDAHDQLFGIRTIRLDRSDTPDDEGRFRFVVNDVPVHVLGTNWVALDALHARDAERLPAALALLDASGCNLVRCWGGNLYEDEPFFDWCDRHGVLVWQDLALACARYPQTEPFVSQLRSETEQVARRLRGHASLALWCGSNENDDSYLTDGLDPNTDILTRHVLPAVLQREDPGRAYVPGSPYYPPAYIAAGRTDVPEQHLWGARAAFKEPFYSAPSARLVSEIGFHGCPEERSLSRFLPQLRAEIDVDDPQWRLHETHQRRTLPARDYNRNQLMLDQAEMLFGPLGRDLSTVVPASQISQAEALKFFVETSRLDPDRSGVVWWNLLDCWPQISDAVVDYYFERKLAFHYLRRVQQPVCIAVREASGWWHDVVLVAHGPWAGSVRWTIQRTDQEEAVAAGTAQLIGGDARIMLGRLPVTRGPAVCYLLTWHGDGLSGCNHYVAGGAPFDLDTYLRRDLPQIAGLDAAFTVEGLWARR